MKAARNPEPGKCWGCLTRCLGICLKNARPGKLTCWAHREAETMAQRIATTRHRIYLNVGRWQGVRGASQDHQEVPSLDQDILKAVARLHWDAFAGPEAASRAAKSGQPAPDSRARQVLIWSADPASPEVLIAVYIPALDRLVYIPK